MIHGKILKVMFGSDGFRLREPHFMLKMKISIGTIHKDVSLNVLFRGWLPKQGKRTSLQRIFKIVDGYTISRTSLWGFESTICIRLTNGNWPLCGISVNLHVFRCLIFQYFTFCRSCKRFRGELMNMVKHMLDGLNVYVKKHLVPQERNILGRSQMFSFIRENWQVDLSLRSLWSRILCKVNRKIWVVIIQNLKRRFITQGKRSTIVTNSEGTSGYSTRNEQTFRPK